MSACARPARPLPRDLEFADWRTLHGNAARAGYAYERVPVRPEVAWRAEIGRGLLSPPVVDGPALFAAASNRLLTAISTETGEHYWERRLDGAITGGLVHGNGRIFVATEERQGKVYAVDSRRGGRAWRHTVGSSPFPPLLVGDTLFVATEGGRVFALGAAEAAEHWQRRLPGSAAASPVPYRDAVIVATTRDTLLVLARSNGEVRARVQMPAAVSAPPALRGDTLYVPLHSGELVAVGLPGLEQLWRTPLGAPILAAPIAAPDGSLYALTRSAELWRVPPGGRAGERIASLGGAARASLTLVRDGLLVGLLDGRVVLVRHDGTVVWEEGLGGSVFAPAAVSGGAIYVPLLRGVIVKLRETQ